MIINSHWQAFPPRLDWQPIFYPVLNRGYAEQIARDWNTKDKASDYVGFVTAFDVDREYLRQFEEHVVGGSTHRELWIPAEELETFNQAIEGNIRLITAFYGEKYSGSKDYVLADN
ncbi:MAG: hypothetical protein Phog2KO_41050 [Phototrophicaceae bacterium]